MISILLQGGRRFPEAARVAAGLVKGKHMSVDGSFIQANADHHSRVSPEQGKLAEARGAYQDFLTLWKDADPEMFILKQAKAEYGQVH